MKKTRKSPRPPCFATRLRAGDLLVGSIVTMPAPQLVELLAGAGLDWLFLDGEHGNVSLPDFVPLLQAAGTCPCVIRVPAHDPVWIGRALDAGAAGVIVPRVDNAQQARAVVRAAKYPPDGARGMGLARAHGHGLRHADYVRHANVETAVIVQAESAAAVRNIDAICAVPGVDAVLIGPNDLAASLGHPGRLDAAPVTRAIDRVLAACRRARKPAGYFAAQPAGMATALAGGATLAAVGMDTLFLIDAVQALRTAMSAQAGR